MLYKSGAQESEPSLSQLTERRLTQYTRIQILAHSRDCQIYI